MSCGRTCRPGTSLVFSWYSWLLYLTVLSLTTVLAISSLKFQQFTQFPSSCCSFSGWLYSNLFISFSSVEIFLNPFYPCVCLPPLKSWLPESPMGIYVFSSFQPWGHTVNYTFLFKLLPCLDFRNSIFSGIFSCISVIYFHISEYLWNKVTHATMFLYSPPTYIIPFLNFKLNAS